MSGFEIILILGVLVIFFGLPLIVRSIDYPGSIEFRSVEPDELGPAQTEYLEKRETELRQAGFTGGPIFTIQGFENTNISEMFTDEQGNIATTSLISRSDGTDHKGYLEFMTAYEADRFLITKSSASFEMFYDPPGITTVNYFRILGVRPLLQRHMQLRQSFNSPEYAVRYVKLEQVKELQQSVQARTIIYQEERGILRHEAASGRLKGTYRLGLAILSHALSLSAVDSGWRVKTVPFLTGMACVLAISSLTSFGSSNLASNHFLHVLILAALFLGCGGITGIFFIRKALAWTLLSALIPTTFLAMLQTTLPLQVCDLFLLYVSAGFLGSRLRTFGDMEGTYENLIYPGAIVFVLFFIYLLGSR